MKRPRRGHSIEAIFPLILFFVFTLCALTVLLLALNIYRGTTEGALLNETSGTAASYLTKKIQRYDVTGGVAVETWEGRSVLVLRDSRENGDYCTYIYAHEGELKELFVKLGSPALPQSGMTIMPVEDFSARMEEGLILLSCTDPSGREATVRVALNADELP